MDTSLWGNGEAKGLDSLLEEVNEGESYLRLDDSGLVRVVEVAKLHISQPLYGSRGCLVEVSRRLPDGGTAQRNEHPSEKLKRGETPRQAVVRGIWEELQIAEGGILTLSMKLPEMESRASKSFPNLVCLYILHHADVVLFNSVSICHRAAFETTESNGTVHQWKWEKWGA